MRLRCDDVIVDASRRIVILDGVPTALPERVFGTLLVLVRHAGRPVARAEMLSAVWPGTHVDPNSVSQAVAALRRTLASTRAGSHVRTVPGVGYVYAGCVEVEPDRPGAPPRSWRAAAAAVIIGCVAVAVLCNGRHFKGPSAGDEDEAPGLSPIAGRRASELRAAEAAFVRRLGAHPRDAGALAGLAESAYLLGFYGVEARGPAMARAGDAAERAIALDARQSRAYLVRGSIALDTQWNLAASARDFRRAVELDPDDPLVHQWSAWWCLAAGRMPEARAASARATSLDPFSATAITARATFAYLDGDLDSAAADSRRALQLDPRFFRAYLRLGLALLASGRTADALEDLERSLRDGARRARDHGRPRPRVRDHRRSNQGGAPLRDIPPPAAALRTGDRLDGARPPRGGGGLAGGGAGPRRARRGVVRGGAPSAAAARSARVRAASRGNVGAGAGRPGTAGAARPRAGPVDERFHARSPRFTDPPRGGPRLSGA